MRSLGLCIGASTLSMVELVQDSNGIISVVRSSAQSHNGNPQKHVLENLEKIERTSYQGIAVTGRKFRKYINLTSIPEPEAVEEALAWLYGPENDINAIVSAGGETFLVYVLGRDGKITSVRTGNKCASGTGEFFLQQIRRIGISLDDAVTYARTESPYRVSGRCSVFCKSDCTHATNKGIPKGRVAAGLSQMMAGKISELLTHVPRENILLVGGCAQNTVMVDYLKREIGKLIVPRQAPVFEALGCALWALKNETRPLPGLRDLFNHGGNVFSRLAPLKNFEPMVTYKTTEKGEARAGDRCVLGLDVGSTTTKAVIVRLDDNAVCSSVYIRTDGDPVRAARTCYADLHDQLGPLSDRTSIVGLGVTGSGRQIAGLHAMTDGVVNEIIAHATGALFFDRDVDTIFEIGGQDAKYTYIINGVPSDYAMNDACSAGTGSFLEEAARESLAIEMEDIAEIALRGRHPPNFNDQCAAFISSDIKKAFHDGIDGNDVVAGLVYAVCMNYSRRVRGNRPAGKKVFMQGGVCYNRAVPLAMAALTGKPIIVPPDPGLIGAFGVALEVMGRMKLGLLEEGAFSLARLKDREISYGAPFTCDGGRERCDRKCTIARIRIEGKTYPFGGACNRWYNLRHKRKERAGDRNLAEDHERLVFRKYVPPPGETGPPGTPRPWESTNRSW